MWFYCLQKAPCHRLRAANLNFCFIHFANFVIFIASNSWFKESLVRLAVSLCYFQLELYLHHCWMNLKLLNSLCAWRKISSPMVLTIAQSFIPSDSGDQEKWCVFLFWLLKLAASTTPRSLIEQPPLPPMPLSHRSEMAPMTLWSHIPASIFREFLSWNVFGNHSQFSIAPGQIMMIKNFSGIYGSLRIRLGSCWAV